ncbi:MAG: methyltransferase [Desulfonauticus sp.]|nr:methyltransferase [Desulfonauticus sp.]
MHQLKSMSLNELLSKAEQKYPLTFEPVKVGNLTIELAQIKDLENYLDQLAQTEDKIHLPFWAKIWPASILLSHFLVKYLPLEREVQVLEIGAGLGICGLFLAKKGFKVVISDIEEDALLFIQINVLKNNLSQNVSVRALDFTQTQSVLKADYIVGSEVLYQEKYYRSQVKFFLNNLKPAQKSEIILAQSYTRKASSFFKLAQKEFNIQQKTLGYKSQDNIDKEKFLANIYRLTPKKHV